LIPTRIARITDERLGTFHRFWTSLEGENPSGSIKDRMVEPELSYGSKDLKEISEISAGSTALSLSYFASQFKLRCHLFVPKGIDALIKKQLIMRGALLTECDPKSAYRLYEDFLKKSGKRVWPFGQMKRKELNQHYKNWAKKDLEPFLPPFDFVVGSVGTGHSLTGVADGLSPKSGCISIEPLSGLSVNGIRNLQVLNFGDTDPCHPSYFKLRIETGFSETFSNNLVETDRGPVYMGDSFRLVLGGTLKLICELKEKKNIFLVGAHCRRANGG
jgi:cysteine synthase A